MLEAGIEGFPTTICFMSWIEQSIPQHGLFPIPPNMHTHLGAPTSSKYRLPALCIDKMKTLLLESKHPSSHIHSNTSELCDFWKSISHL